MKGVAGGSAINAIFMPDFARAARISRFEWPGIFLSQLEATSSKILHS